MTDYYAVGTGNFQGGNIWALTSGGAPSVQTPTSSDNVIFDTHSTGTVTIGTNSNCLSFTMTAPGAGTITMGGTAVLNIAGNMSLAAGMTFAPNAASTINFTSTSAGQTVTSAGYRLGIINFNGVGGAWQLQDALNPVAGVSITLTNGSLDTNGQAVGATSGVVFLSSNSNTRSLTLGSTTWTLPNSVTAGVLHWNITNPAGMTLSAASSTINSLNTSNGGFTTASLNPTFAGGGLQYGTVQALLITSGTIYITGSNTFTNLTLTTTNVGLITSGFVFGSNQIITGTLTATGNTIARRAFFYSDTIGTPRTLTAAVVTMASVDLRDIVGAGVGNWDLSAITGGSGDCGGNSGIIFNSPKNCYLKTTVDTSYSSITKWFTTSGGSTQITPAMPMVQDTCYIDVSAFPAGTHIYTSDLPRSAGLDFTGVNTLLGVNLTSGAVGDQEYYGSIILAANCTGVFIPNPTILYFCGRGNYQLKDAGLGWASGGNIAMYAPGGKITQADNLTTGTTTTFSCTAGTWDDGGFTTSFKATTVNGGTLKITNTWSCTTFAMSSGVMNLSGQINASSTITLSGGTTNDSGAAGEYKGTNFSCTNGTHTLRKLTLSSTFAQSGGSITVPALGTITWGTASTWTWTPNTFVFTTGGIPTWTGSSLVVAAAIVSSNGGSWLSC